MNKVTKLDAEKRQLKGNKVKALRKTGKIPANIYGSDIESVAITVELDDFSKAFDQAGETGIVEVSFEDEKRNVLISDIQYGPVSGDILHVDFREVNLNKKISAMVPVELVGDAPAEKTGIGVLVQHINELEVEALPLDLPDKFEIDVTKMETLDDHILVSDIKVDSQKVQIQAESDLTIANITEIREEEPEPEPEVEEGQEQPTEEGSLEEKTSNGEDNQSSETSNS